MSVVGDLRAALRDNLKTIPDIQVSRYALPNPTPPGIHILPPGAKYHMAMSSGLTEYTFTVQAFVALNADSGPQILLDELLDETAERSLCNAVESDPTLGGLAEDVYCSEASPARFLVTADNRALLTSDWTVTVYVDGST
jgi:hypothetical protein